MGKVLGKIAQAENAVFNSILTELISELGVGSLGSLTLVTTGVATGCLLPEDVKTIFDNNSLAYTYFNTRLQTEEDLTVVQDLVSGGELSWYIVQYSTIVPPTGP